MPLPKRRWNDVSDASYRANEITTIVNGSMLMTPKAFESHASLINLERKLTKSCDRACLLFTDAGEAEQEEERRRRRDAEKERRQRRRRLGFSFYVYFLFFFLKKLV
ncbi:hypothetical protein IGI04_026127 [Brassica rapa subsp. trilocularis]|uniref:Uncharacterized protein n=1 Tax=Brassica rapa subsp. trilocularis TaxID=1813537 RepID=A0ABQ7KV37_BRACM|nr:hypothetical protein IGI04_026127 [Brassica rapa subsp. trilocularis]